MRQYISMKEEEVLEFLRSQKVMFVATLTEDSRPHNTPLWYIAHDRKLYFRSQTYKRKVLNIKRDPWVSCAVEDGEKYTELRGVSILAKARIIEEGELRELVNKGLLEKYSKERNYEEMPEEWRREREGEERAIIEVTPVRVFSWDNRKWVAIKESGKV